MNHDDAVFREPKFDCLWPLGPTAFNNIELAPRVGDLSGKTVAELWDFLFHGDIIFARIREELSKRFPRMTFVGFDAFGDTHGYNRNDVLARMPMLLREHRIDAVISAVGA